MTRVVKMMIFKHIQIITTPRTIFGLSGGYLQYIRVVRVVVIRMISIHPEYSRIKYDIKYDTKCIPGVVSSVHAVESIPCVT